MADPAPQFDHVERAVLKFVVDKLTSGCSAIQRDSLELFLTDHGVGSRTVAICKLFLELGIFETQVLPKYPVFTHELGSLDKSEAAALLEFAQQRDAAQNLFRISGKAILFQKALEQVLPAPQSAPAEATRPHKSSAELLTAIEKADLSKAEDKVLRLVADRGGRVPIQDAKLLCECDVVSAFKRAKVKLRKLGWHLFENKTALCVEPLKKKVQN